MWEVEIKMSLGCVSGSKQSRAQRNRDNQLSTGIYGYFTGVIKYATL